MDRAPLPRPLHYESGRTISRQLPSVAPHRVSPIRCGALSCPQERFPPAPHCTCGWPHAPTRRSSGHATYSHPPPRETRRAFTVRALQGIKWCLCVCEQAIRVGQDAQQASTSPPDIIRPVLRNQLAGVAAAPRLHPGCVCPQCTTPSCVCFHRTTLPCPW
jgi:hypothetical protein